VPELGSPASFTLWYVAVYVVSLAGAWALATIPFGLVRRRRRRKLRPEWARMLADTDYFHKSISRILAARGYQVERSWVITDPIERQAREVVLAVRRRGVPHAALCGRWVIPITSEVVARFEAALASTHARRGLIVTTSHFTEAAVQKAAGYPVELVDGEELKAWIREIW
jgi:hypothetical protein